MQQNNGGTLARHGVVQPYLAEVGVLVTDHGCIGHLAPPEEQQRRRSGTMVT